MSGNAGQDKYCTKLPRYTSLRSPVLFKCMIKLHYLSSWNLNPDEQLFRIHGFLVITGFSIPLHFCVSHHFKGR